MTYVFDYSKLRGRIKEMFGNEENFADSIGKSRVTINNKLNCKRGFSQEEIYLSVEKLKLTKEQIPEYFFCKECSQM